MTYSHIAALGALALVSAAAGAQEAASGTAPAVRIDQVGFYPAAPKRAVVVGARGERFAVIGDRGDTALAGTLSPSRSWAPSAEEGVRTAELTRLTRPGRYVLAVAGGGRSTPFVVSDTALRAVARASVKAFYFQRVGVPLPARYAGRWARAAGHPDTAVLVHPSAASAGRPAGTRVRSPGGWYDAGDYNKYVVNSGISTYTLLALAEHYPEYAARLATNVPESGDAVPDVLDEALFNLRWMRTMQDPADGGVYHKLTNPEFDAFVAPEAARGARYVVQKGTAATLDFAAVAAHAALVVGRYPRELPGLADSLVREAAAAWAWARQHPDSLYDQDRLNRVTAPKINTGAYGDRDVRDELRWAAAELYLATRADSFLVVAVAPNETVDGVPGWNSVATLGLYSLVDHRRELPAGADTAALVGRLVGLARGLAARARESAYGVTLETPDFVWGSNAVAANQGMALVQAWRATGDTSFLAPAVADLDYLLGRNAVGYSFVTGYGARTPQAPHHRLSGSDTVAAPIPGLLVGGPNAGQQDHCPGYPTRVPALSYLDAQCAYAANEIAINWNAPFAYLAGALDAIYSSTRDGTVPRPLTRQPAAQ